MSEKTAEIIGRWLGRVQAVLLWTVAALIWVGVYFAFYFAVILMEEAKVGADRLTLRGSGDRSEKIRTYNFPQNRMTDHRIGLTLYSLDRIVDGEIQQLLEQLREHDLEDRIGLAIETRRGD